MIESIISSLPKKTIANYLGKGLGYFKDLIGSLKEKTKQEKVGILITLGKPKDLSEPTLLFCVAQITETGKQEGELIIKVIKEPEGNRHMVYSQAKVLDMIMEILNKS